MESPRRPSGCASVTARTSAACDRSAAVAARGPGSGTDCRRSLPSGRRRLGRDTGMGVKSSGSGLIRPACQPCGPVAARRSVMRSCDRCSRVYSPSEYGHPNPCPAGESTNGGAGELARSKCAPSLERLPWLPVGRIARRHPRGIPGGWPAQPWSQLGGGLRPLATLRISLATGRPSLFVGPDG